MALTLLVVFLIFAVGGRVLLQYRLTGDHGLRPANTNSSVTAKLSSVLLFAAFISIFSLAFMDAFGFYSPETYKLPKYLGGLVSFIGIGLTVVSQYQMGSSWRIGVDEAEHTKLIKNGLYSRIRNPIYTGVLVFCLGLLFIMPSAYMLLCVIGVAVSIEVHVRFVEEPYLRDKHGLEFNEYENSTGRYWLKKTR